MTGGRDECGTTAGGTIGDGTAGGGRAGEGGAGDGRSRREADGSGARIRPAVRWSALAVSLLGLVAACAGCSAGGDEVDAAGTGGPVATDTSADAGSDTVAGDATAGTDADTDSDSGAASGDRPVPRVDVPYVPPIVLPDVSVLGEGAGLVEESVGDLASPTTGLDVVSASCTDGELVYQGEDSGSFFDVATDGAGTYSDLGGDNSVVVEVAADGSGTYSDQGGDRSLIIEANPDGSGTYSDQGGDRSLLIEVAADGSGTYSDQGGDRSLRIAILPDGTGTYNDSGGDRSLDIAVLGDGAGTYTDLGGDRNAEITADRDGSWTFSDQGGSRNLRLEVAADGSGTFVDVTNDVTITVDSSGQGTYLDEGSGFQDSFTTEIGILDPEVLIAGPRPVFAVADRFPPVDRLGQLQPPCVTIVRLSGDVLFDFDSDHLRPEAQEAVDAVAAAVGGSDKAIEVHGHTDSKGDDAYNLDLSERRARAFEAALVAAGVTNEITITGFGETRPVAPNEGADGSDDPAGRQLNRRVEVVIPE